MASCKDVADFLGQVSSRQAGSAPASVDPQRLGALGYVKLLSASDYQALTARVGTLDTSATALEEENSERSALAAKLGQEYQRDHSILFHLRGKDAQQGDLDQETRDRAQFQGVEADYAAKEQAFNQLVADRSVLDTLGPFGTGYVGLTPAGAVALRDLTVRLYRYSDTDFEAYLAQAQKIDADLATLADGGASYVGGLASGITDADRAYLWAIAIGLAKTQPDASQGVATYLNAYRATSPFTDNTENRLMASEILVAAPTALADAVPALGQLYKDARSLGVPSESALGVASILLFGRRADGSFATDSVRQYLQMTRSYETAALLGIVNVPVETLSAKFQSVRALFAGWGYEYSEDTELSSAYLAVSDLQPNDVVSKLAILARGLNAYLQYPLVAASILASIPTLEANETLNVVEKAYDVVGRRAAGLSQGELICVAVRMVHGLRNELIGDLDATATQAAAAATGTAGGMYGLGPRVFFLPVAIVHGGYYSTFGGISGVHPGHVHGMATGFGGAGVG